METATGVVIFDTQTFESATLMEFNEADLIVLYLLYFSEADVYLIDPPRRTYRTLYDPLWLRLSGLEGRENSWVQHASKRLSAARRYRVASLADHAGKSLLGIPDKIGPGAPFPAVSQPYRHEPERCVFSPDGRYRIETMSYVPDDGRFGDSPEEFQQLIETSTNVMILESLALGSWVTMTFDPAGLVHLRVPVLGTSRAYLLDPERRLYARAEAAEAWLLLTDLRDAEWAISRVGQANFMQEWRRSSRMRLFKWFAWMILGALTLAGLICYLSLVPR